MVSVRAVGFIKNGCFNGFMLEKLLWETREIVQRTEEAARLWIRIMPGEAQYRSRTALAAYLANPTASEIAIAYNPEAESIDYAIAHEAVRVMRYFEAAPEERYVLGSTPETRSAAYRQMERDIQALPAPVRDVVRGAFPMFYEGMLTQLASAPADPWINNWLLDNYPSFDDEIQRGLTDIMWRCHEALEPEAERLTPRTVYRASNGINAAFADFAAELLDRDDYAVPYNGTQHEKLGRALQKHNAMDRGHPGDRETAAEWARMLGMEGWYGWKAAAELSLARPGGG